MKSNFIFCSVAAIAIGWIAYALFTLNCLNCSNVVFYLIPHVVFGVLLVSFLRLSLKELDNKIKDRDLVRKIIWDVMQLELYKSKKTFEAGISKPEKPLEAEKLTFDQLLEFAKKFKLDEEKAIKKKMEALGKDIEMLKNKKDLTVEIIQPILNKLEESSNPNTLETDE